MVFSDDVDYDGLIRSLTTDPTCEPLPIPISDTGVDNQVENENNQPSPLSDSFWDEIHERGLNLGLSEQQEAHDTSGTNSAAPAEQFEEARPTLPDQQQEILNFENSLGTGPNVEVPEEQEAHDAGREYSIAPAEQFNQVRPTPPLQSLEYRNFEISLRAGQKFEIPEEYEAQDLVPMYIVAPSEQSHDVRPGPSNQGWFDSSLNPACSYMPVWHPYPNFNSGAGYGNNTRMRVPPGVPKSWVPSSKGGLASSQNQATSNMQLSKPISIFNSEAEPENSAKTPRKKCSDKTCKRNVNLQDPSSGFCFRHLQKHARNTAGPPFFQIDPKIDSFDKASKQVYLDVIPLNLAGDDFGIANENRWIEDFITAVNKPYEAQGVSENFPYDKFHARQQTVFNGKQFDNETVNVRLRFLYKAALTFHEGGTTVYPKGGDNDGYGSAHTELIFSARLKTICGILKLDKRVCMDVIEGRGVTAFVANPLKYEKRKTQNKDSNTKKQELQKRGEELEEKEKRGPKRTRSEKPDEGAEPASDEEEASTRVRKPAKRQRLSEGVETDPGDPFGNYEGEITDEDLRMARSLAFPDDFPYNPENHPS